MPWIPCLPGFGAFCQSFHSITSSFASFAFQFIFWLARLILLSFYWGLTRRIMQTCIIFPLVFFCLLCQIALLTHWFMFQLFISQKNCGLNGKTTVCLLSVLILNPGHRWYPVTLEYSEFEYMTRLVIYHNHSPHACILHIYSRAIRNWGVKLSLLSERCEQKYVCVLGISDIQGCGHGLYPRGVGEAGSCPKGGDAGEL